MTDRKASVRERLALDATTWVDSWRGWLQDDGATYQEYAAGLPWRESRIWRYDHFTTEPRMTASLPRAGLAAHPVLHAATVLLRNTYQVELDGPALSYYRDGRDGLGAHRDRELRYTSNTLVAILSLGTRRPWTLTPLRGPKAAVRGRLRPEPTIDLQPGDGDLFVLGGRGQADWLHAVPPVAALRAGRISAQWRWTARTGPPERGPGYRAPRHYSG